MNSSNKRQSNRAHVDFPVTIEIVDYGTGFKWVARAFNISTSGILVWSVRPLPLNVPLVIHFPQEWARAFTIVKAVRRDDLYYGCEFIDPPDKIVSVLDLAVDKFHRQDLPRPLNTLWNQL